MWKNQGLAGEELLGISISGIDGDVRKREGKRRLSRSVKGRMREGGRQVRVGRIKGRGCAVH